MLVCCESGSHHSISFTPFFMLTVHVTAKYHILKWNEKCACAQTIIKK